MIDAEFVALIGRLSDFSFEVAVIQGFTQHLEDFVHCLLVFDKHRGTRCPEASL